jgi:hypothetical protein
LDFLIKKKKDLQAKLDENHEISNRCSKWPWIITKTDAPAGAPVLLFVRIIIHTHGNRDYTTLGYKLRYRRAENSRRTAYLYLFCFRNLRFSVTAFLAVQKRE